jgi:uncharacterized membrane protein
MATAAVQARRSAFRFRAKYAVFAVVGMMIAYVIHHNESFLWHPDAPIWQHYEGFKWYLLPHGLAGACAILLGPLQFSDRLRQRFTRLHRVLGRLYVTGALIVSPLGVYLQYFNERIGGSRSFTLAAATNAVLLMLTTGVAFVFIRQRKIQQHRQWMTRSFAVAIVFLEVRVISGLAGWENPVAIETTVWICLAFSLLVGDLALQLQEYLRTRPSVTAQATAL